MQDKHESKLLDRLQVKHELILKEPDEQGTQILELGYSSWVAHDKQVKLPLEYEHVPLHPEFPVLHRTQALSELTYKVAELQDKHSTFAFYEQVLQLAMFYDPELHV